LPAHSVVTIPRPHIHRERGSEQMKIEDERPLYTTKVGNTTLRIRSNLPFMTKNERAEWFRQNESLPEVKMIKNAWIAMLHQLQREEAAKKTEG
jgi:hypothetical protein